MRYFEITYTVPYLDGVIASVHVVSATSIIEAITSIVASHGLGDSYTIVKAEEI